MATPDAGEPRPGLAQQPPLAAIVILLSMAAGATDALSLLHLGGAFSSVITGNLVVIGAGAALGELTAMLRAVVAIALYGLGAFAAARLAARPRFASAGGARARPRAAVALLTVEVVVLLALWAGWLAAGQHPTGHVQLPLIALAGAAMGIQSVAVQALGHGQLSTTYLTGALTRLVSTVGVPGWRRQLDRVQAVALAGVLAGAVLSALLVRGLPWLGPVPAALLAAITAGFLAIRARRGRL